MLNYFNFKKFKDKYLITNDMGRYAFLNSREFENLLNEKYNENKELYKLLKQKYFVYDTSQIAFSQDAIYALRDCKNYLFKGTQLHIFVVTNACNLQCIYCQAQNGKKVPKGFMDIDTARKAVDVALQSPLSYLEFEFQGGEPLLNFEIIKYIVQYSKKKAKDKKINYSVVTNLTLLTEEMLHFFVENNIGISTSLDGDAYTHNMNRPFRIGGNTFSEVYNKICYLKEQGIYVGALQTTTHFSLNRFKEIVDTYVKLGMDSISIRALTPLGCANENWKKIGYTAEEFLDFYKKTLEYIIEVNKQGYIIKEGQASIFLMKILEGVSLNYMELRSPCGASIGQIAYYYDGNVYTCDEGRMLAEMGNPAFKLGSLKTDDYNTLMDSKVCKTACVASILESIPSCSDCVYQPYCGTCPVVNYALYKDIYEKYPGGYKCKIYKGILDIIFSILLDGDLTVENIFKSWIL